MIKQQHSTTNSKSDSSDTEHKIKLSDQLEQQHFLLPLFNQSNYSLIEQLSKAFSSYTHQEASMEEKRDHVGKIKSSKAHKKSGKNEPGSYSSSTSPSLSSSSSSNSPSHSPQPEPISKPFPSHSCYTLPNTSSYSSLSTTLPKSASSASISSQVKLKLKNCILQKLRNSNPKVESTPVLHPQPVRPHETKSRRAVFAPPPPPCLDEALLRRTSSEPNLKVKSALKDRLIEKRNMLNQSKCSKRIKLDNQSESNEQIVLAAAIAAATAALSQQPQNILQQIAFIQQQLMRTERAQLSVPNLNFYQNQSQPVNHENRSKFGHMVHVEEDNELLLENELKHVAKQNENELNKVIYNEQPLPRANSYQFEHRHKKYFNYMQQKEQSKQIDNRYFSFPNLFASNINTSTSSATSINHQEITTISGAEQEEKKEYKHTTGLVYDAMMLRHECACKNARVHLERADRIRAIWNRIRSAQLDSECEVVRPKMATISDLLLCHNEQYTLIFGTDFEQRVKLPKEYLQAYMMNVCMAPCKGLALKFDLDNCWNEEFTPLACRIAVGSTYQLAALVAGNRLRNGFAIVRPPGSHAEYNKPLGFCYFNTVAIVAKMLKKNLGLERVLIVDWDVHHGNGTQQLTYDDANILYISLHRHDHGNFFPGTGAVQECGSEMAPGFNVNIAWNTEFSGALGDVEYLAAFRSIVMPIAKSFAPQIVLVSCGFDATEQHSRELGGFRLTPTCFAYMTRKLMSLADGKLVLALEGGYDLQSLCDSSEMCLRALLNKQIPAFSNSTLDSLPGSDAIQDMLKAIQIQKKYWPEVEKFVDCVKISHNQYIRVFTE
ncbi:histone deacetylase 4 isoform X7 [Brachionus plicatilis]|uniref:histone deacetylase n=1 Tax=Brachionus plicatilis TaxID=10195 RepID=A0A3M7RFZ3_BRAPC|nr:histone deacetylase 4 isoform X7 [Brachionus plicatilis]